MRATLLPLLVLALSRCALATVVAESTGSAAPASQEAPTVDQTLDAFHGAAARADEAAYFALMGPQFVFLGTDATERWDKAAFQAFAHPYFSQGKGWTFVPRNRHVDFSSDGGLAWFDELLDSATYGECRGSGVLERLDGAWRLQQYHLTIPMPNDLAKELVARIREARPKTQP